MKKVIVALLALLALATSASPQQAGRFEHTLQSARDTDQITNFEYCRMVPPNSQPRGLFVETSGLSATVTEETAGQLPFANVSVGDELLIRSRERVISAGAQVTAVGQSFRRVVMTKASGASITVDTALNITSASFSFSKIECGTAITNGWVPVNSGLEWFWHLVISQINTTTGVDYTVECRLNTTVPAAVTIVASTTVTTVTSIQLPAAAAAYPTGLVTAPWYECRFGTRLTTTDDGSDVGAAAEQVSVYLVGRLE